MKDKNNFLKILTFLSLKLCAIRAASSVAVSTNSTGSSTGTASNEGSSNLGNILIYYTGLPAVATGLSLVFGSAIYAFRAHRIRNSGEGQGLLDGNQTNPCLERLCRTALFGIGLTVTGAFMAGFGVMYNNPDIDYSTYSP